MTFMSLSRTLLIAVSAAFAALVTVPPVNADFSMDKVEPSVVRVGVYRGERRMGHGSGFIVNKNHVVTNEHVANAVNNGMSLYILPSNTRRKYPAEVVHMNAALDIAILRITEGKMDRPAVSLLSTPEGLEKGDSAHALGFKGLSDNSNNAEWSIEPTYNDGIVETIQQQAVRSRRWIIRHSNEISNGSSGGPLFDDCNRVIGITSAGERTRFGTIQELSIHIREAIPLLEEHDVDYTGSGGSCIVGMPSGSFYGTVIALIAVLSAITFYVVKVRGAEPKTETPGHPRTVSDRRGAAQPGGQAGGQRGGQRGGTQPKRSTGRVKNLIFAGFDDRGQALRIEMAGDALQNSKNGLSVGRSADYCDYVINSPAISKRHFRVSAQDGNFYIMDLNSSNSTFCLGSALEPFKQVRLSPGDEIRIGTLRLKVAII